MKWLTPRIAIFSLATVHLVGLVGFWLAPTLFGRLTPVNLLYSAFLVFWFHRHWSRPFLIACFLIALGGFAVEWAGVASGQVFGAYSYGDGLGFKWLGVPLLIGLNWLLLVYCTASASLYLKAWWWLRALLAASLMVALDVLIEPFAMRYGLWDWQGGIVPLQNYVAWFVVALLLLLPFHYFQLAERNRVAVALYVIQILFFGLLLILSIS